jgi:alanine racemase
MNDVRGRAEPMIPARAGGLITVDLKALQRNYRRLARMAEPATCAASLKANAYGIGLVRGARALHAAGCRIFFVAFPEEGRNLRKALAHRDNSEVEIYVLCGLLAGETAFYDEHRLCPVLNGPSELSEWLSYCRAKNRKLPAAIHVETGMNRMAFTDKQLAELAGQRALIDQFQPALILSHLARAEQTEHKFNEIQRRRFERARALLPAARASLANSAGIFLGQAFRYDVVRPGIALYGGNPLPGQTNPCEPVLEFFAKVLQVRDVAMGAPVGYGGGWTASRRSRVAVLGIGYADGYPRSLAWPVDGEPTRVRIGDFYAPVIGRISMDMTTVDVTDLAAGTIERGTVAELIGGHVTVDEVAAKAGTNSFEILTRLGMRCPRLYSSFDSYRGNVT